MTLISLELMHFTNTDDCGLADGESFRQALIYGFDSIQECTKIKFFEREPAPGPPEFFSEIPIT